MPSAFMASLTRYSRNMGPSAACPSPPRENRVLPEPLRCRSHTCPLGSVSSPSKTARPSPSRGTYDPNWCPAYACATGSALSGSANPVRKFTPAADQRKSESSPNSRANFSLPIIRCGAKFAGACQGSANSGSSRAKLVPSVTDCALVLIFRPYAQGIFAYLLIPQSTVDPLDFAALLELENEVIATFRS